MKVIEPTLEYGGLAEVQAAMKRTRDAVVYRRLQAILGRMQSQSIEETCRQVQISRDTLHAWVRRWNEGGVTRLTEGKRTGRARKLTAEVKDLVIKEIEGRLPDGTPYKALWLHGHLKKKTRADGRLLDPLPQSPGMGICAAASSPQGVQGGCGGSSRVYRPSPSSDRNRRSRHLVR